MNTSIVLDNDTSFEKVPSAIIPSGDPIYTAQDISNFTFFALVDGIDLTLQMSPIYRDLVVPSEWKNPNAN